MPPVPVCPSPRPQDSVATVLEQTANMTPAAEEAIAGPGAGARWSSEWTMPPMLEPVLRPVGSHLGRRNATQTATHKAQEPSRFKLSP